MMLRYFVDTDGAIHWLHGHQRIQERMAELRERGLAFSAVSLAELWEGVCYSRHPQESEKHLHDFLKRVSHIGIDEEMCRLFGKERGRLRAEGRRIGDLSLATKAPQPPTETWAHVLSKAPVVVGKSGDPTKPVIYALPDESTATARGSPPSSVFPPS
jgi:predicted nucleic acid-binding protein